MEYNGKTLDTIGKIFDEALRIAKTGNQDEAMNYFKAYVNWIHENNEDGVSLEEAERIAKSNFGYYAGYYNKETTDIIYKTYQCQHPIFGANPFGVSAEEAFNAGYNSANS